ncbi:MAG TPA: SDR family NAD(P)-dependent oxidoreductase [Hyphomicrobiaceae bacterium]|jgi:3-oxoacyl-[acyl-carrier protein] reductase
MRLADLTLRDRVAVVTGGGRGIGRAISLAFAQFGASVCVADASAEAGTIAASEIEAMGGKALAVRADVAVAADVAEVVEKCVGGLGGIDILVNNAGGASGGGFKIGRVMNIEEQDWDGTLDANLKSAFLCSRSVGRLMLEQKRGAIVNMASVTGRMPWAGLPAYSAAKAAVISLTRSLAVELAPHVRVNAIAPGLIETPRTSRNRRPEQLDQLLTNVPLGRQAQPEEVADLAVYLASDVAAWMTGAVVDFTGGQLWMAEDGRPKFRDVQD